MPAVRVSARSPYHVKNYGSAAAGIGRTYKHGWFFEKTIKKLNKEKPAMLDIKYLPVRVSNHEN
jgi:hypothetical protein